MCAVIGRIQRKRYASRIRQLDWLSSLLLTGRCWSHKAVMWLRLCFSNLRKIWTSLTLISSLVLWSLTFYPLAYQACFSIRQKLKIGKSPGGTCLRLTHRGKEINKKRISFPCRNMEQLLCAGRAVASVDRYTQCVWCASLKFWNLIICVSVAPISLLAEWVTKELSWGKDGKMNQINLLFSEPVFPPTSVSDVAALLSGSFLLEGINVILQQFMAQRSLQGVFVYLFGCATSYAGSSSPTRDQTWAPALGAQS